MNENFLWLFLYFSEDLHLCRMIIVHYVNATVVYDLSPPLFFAAFESDYTATSKSSGIWSDGRTDFWADVRNGQPIEMGF